MANWKNKWYWVGIGTIALTVISDRISENTKDIPLIEPIVNGFGWLYNVGMSILLYDIKLWIVILAIVAFYFLYRLYNAISTDQVPDFLEYKSDVVIEWLWKWGYQSNGRGGYEMTYMIPYCPKCEVALRLDHSYSKARCPNCSKEYRDGGNFVVYQGTSEKTPGKWEDYTDTLHIIQARIDKYKKK